MGKIKKGILGGFSGLVGTVVGARWRGIDVIKSRPVMSNTDTTLAQDVHRAKFTMAIRFVSSINDLLQITYDDSAKNMSGSNSALSQVMTGAVTGDYPDLRIDYKLVSIGKGNLPNGSSPTMIQGATGVLKFQWTDNTGIGMAKDNDKAIMVAYCEELRHAAYTIGAVLRKDASGLLQVPAFVGKEVQTWLMFISDNGKFNSSSVFTGTLVVS